MLKVLHVHSYSFVKSQFIRKLDVGAQALKELALIKRKFLKNFSISDIPITSSNRELGNKFHSFQSNSHGLCVVRVTSASCTDFRPNLSCLQYPVLLHNTVTVLSCPCAVFLGIMYTLKV